jgi:hypothetical protein
LTLILRSVVIVIITISVRLTLTTRSARFAATTQMTEMRLVDVDVSLLEVFTDAVLLATIPARDGLRLVGLHGRVACLALLLVKHALVQYTHKLFCI